MAETENMADLVHQDGEQVDAPGRRTVGICCNAEIREGLVELEVVVGAGVDEPAVAGGGGVKGNGQAIGLAELTTGQVGDLDAEIGKAVGIGGGESEGAPEPQRFFKNWSKCLAG